MKHLLILLIAAITISAQSISLSLHNDRSNYAVGDTLNSLISIVIPTGFHLYSNPLGPGIGKPLSVKVEHTEQIKWIDGFSDQPEKFQQDETDWVWQWDDSVHIFVRGIVAGGSGISPFTVSVDGLICKESCIPQNKSVSGFINIGSKGKMTFGSTTRSLRKNAVSFPISISGTAPTIVSTPNTSPKKPTNSSTDLLNVIDTIQPAKAIDTTPVIIDTEIAKEVVATTIPARNYAPREASSVLSGADSQKNFTFGLAIIFALIAGFILNFMPCVLPVLGIKIVAFSEGNADSKSVAVKNSLSFAAGMIFVFMILATLAAFAGMSWGEQFQNPAFIVGIISVMFLFGLGMFDLFIILVPNKIAELERKQDSHSLLGNFSKGVFATLLATPCSGPFLGATLAWTVTQPKLTIYAVFLALGIGMASPYILLAASRRLSRLIPKPGAWMENFKQILGFFLFGFAVYLMIGLPKDLVVPTISFLTFLAATVIAYTRIAPFGSLIGKKLIAVLVSATLLFSGYFVSFTTIRSAVTETTATNWIPFTKTSFEQALNNRRNVVLDFTAVWCMNCKFNEKNVYHTDKMDSLIEAKKIVAFTGDMTNDNPELEKLRSALKGESIPFFVVFPANDPEHPIIFRDLVNKEQLFKILKDLP